jgi:hypothetical protein
MKTVRVSCLNDGINLENLSIENFDNINVGYIKKEILKQIKSHKYSSTIKVFLNGTYAPIDEIFLSNIIPITPATEIIDVEVIILNESICGLEESSIKSYIACPLVLDPMSYSAACAWLAKVPFTSQTHSTRVTEAILKSISGSLFLDFIHNMYFSLSCFPFFSLVYPPLPPYESSASDSFSVDEAPSGRENVPADNQNVNNNVPVIPPIQFFQWGLLLRLALFCSFLCYRGGPLSYRQAAIV